MTWVIFSFCINLFLGPSSFRSDLIHASYFVQIWIGKIWCSSDLEKCTCQLPGAQVPLFSENAFASESIELPPVELTEPTPVAEVEVEIIDLTFEVGSDLQKVSELPEVTVVTSHVEDLVEEVNF